MCKILKVKVTFLGTGSSLGIPVLGSRHPVCLSQDPHDKRLRSSILVEWDGVHTVVDCGPDFRQQLLKHMPPQIDAILFTHEHSDHIIGFDDIRPLGFEQGSIPVYADDRVIKALKKRFYYFFGREEATIVKGYHKSLIDVHTITETPIYIRQNKIIPISVNHGPLPIYGFRFGDFTYITDAKTITPENFNKITGTRVLVVNAIRMAPHPGHFNLEEALDFIARVNPEKAYITHISHFLGFHKEVEKTLPENVHLAYDNLKIEL